MKKFLWVYIVANIAVCLFSILLAGRMKLAPPYILAPRGGVLQEGPWYVRLIGDRYWYGWDYFFESRDFTPCLITTLLSVATSVALYQRAAQPASMTLRPLPEER